MIQFSNAEREQLYHLCRQHKVAKLYLFGSALTEKFDVEKSDLDFMVELLPMEPLENGETLMAFWANLESLFPRKIDLLTGRALNNPFLIKEIAETKNLVYDQQSAQIFI